MPLACNLTTGRRDRANPRQPAGSGVEDGSSFELRLGLGVSNRPGLPESESATTTTMMQAHTFHRLLAAPHIVSPEMAARLSTEIAAGSLKRERQPRWLGQRRDGPCRRSNLTQIKLVGQSTVRRSGVAVYADSVRCSHSAINNGRSHITRSAVPVADGLRGDPRFSHLQRA